MTASQNEITDSRTVPGEGTQGENFDEYHVDEDELTDMIISMFYNKKLIDILYVLFYYIKR